MELITIKGSGFGSFLKTAEHANFRLNQGVSGRENEMELGDNVSRTEVLFSSVAAQVMSWTDTEIVVRVPHRNLYGVGKPHEFFNELATGPLIVRRGSWDVQPDGTCCRPKKWLTLEAGTFTIEAKGMPDPSYFNNDRIDAEYQPVRMRMARIMARISLSRGGALAVLAPNPADIVFLHEYQLPRPRRPGAPRGRANCRQFNHDFYNNMPQRRRDAAVLRRARQVAAQELDQVQAVRREHQRASEPQSDVQRKTPRARPGRRPSPAAGVLRD